VPRPEKLEELLLDNSYVGTGIASLFAKPLVALSIFDPSVEAEIDHNLLCRTIKASSRTL
jgi:hypothetical protein